jgi:hypothetical protein
MRYEDRIRIREAFEINEKLSDMLWDNWSDAAFTVLLVTSDYEFLVRHPLPSDNFTFLKYDSFIIGYLLPQEGLSGKFISYFQRGKQYTDYCCWNSRENREKIFPMDYFAFA